MASAAAATIASVLSDIVVASSCGVSERSCDAAFAPHPPPDSKPGRPMNAPATTGRPSATLTGSAGRRRDAGPFRTRAPALGRDSEEWHGHLTVIDAGCQ